MFDPLRRSDDVAYNPGCGGAGCQIRVMLEIRGGYKRGCEGSEECMTVVVSKRGPLDTTDLLSLSTESRIAILHALTHSVKDFIRTYRLACFPQSFPSFFS